MFQYGHLKLRENRESLLWMTLLLATILFSCIDISTLLIFGQRNAIKRSVVGDFVDSGYGIGNFNTHKEVTAVPWQLKSLVFLELTNYFPSLYSYFQSHLWNVSHNLSFFTLTSWGLSRLQGQCKIIQVLFVTNYWFFLVLMMPLYTPAGTFCCKTWQHIWIVVIHGYLYIVIITECPT